MPLLKSPLLSLGAKGTIGDTLTLQKRGQDTIIRTKPIPAYRQTLLQLYQRWLYEDYAHLWRRQSNATRQEYATAGNRFHLTGFQYWMKYHLKNLPDIAGWWKLDERTGAIAFDSSKNANHGTIFGALPATGVINGGYFFDGINDKIEIALTPSLTTDIVSEFSVEAWAQRSSIEGDFIVSSSELGFPRSFSLATNPTSNPALMLWVGGVPTTVTSTEAMLNNIWYHILATFDGAEIKIYLNSILRGTVPLIGTFNVPVVPLRIGWGWANAYTWPGYIDNVILYNRALTQEDATSHSQRRYPPQ